MAALPFGHDARRARQKSAIMRRIIGLSAFGMILPSLAVAQQLPRVQLTTEQIDLIQHDVRAALKTDPVSAKFGNIVAGLKNPEVTYVCGLLNSKNSGGDFTGLEPFIGLLGKKADGSLGFLPLAEGDVAGRQCATRGLTP
jgi:hypothetical protein